MDDLTFFYIAACLCAAPGATVSILYLLLRAAGRIQVTADGWHAADVTCFGKTLADAVRVFSLFQPLMRREAAWLRRFAAASERDAVSEVVVELVVIG